MVRRILDGRRRIVVADEGLTLHHHCYTENCAAAVVLGIEHPERSAGTIFNVADEEVLTIRQVVELCAAELGAGLEIVSMPYELAVPAWPLLAQPLPTHRVLDLTRLHEQLGHRDVVPARDAVPRTARWLADNPPARRGIEEQVLTDPFDYVAEDALMDSWLAARAAVFVPDFAVAPRWGLAYSGPEGRPRMHAEFDASTRARRTSMSGPMAGVRVLDLSIALTGPYAAALLADQGASVIKVERPGIGDIARWVGVSVNGMSSLYLVCNRGKRSIAVDIQTPEGVDVVRRLAAESDVIVENFRPGVMDRLGLGYEHVREVHPDVVYASLSGFGTVGPYRDRSAYDTVMQAYGGFAMNQADPAGRRTDVPAPNGRRQGHRAVRRAGDHRGPLRARRRPRRSTPRVVDDGCRRVVPLGRLRGQRSTDRIRRVAELEFRRRFPADALRRRLGDRDADV